MPQSMPAIVLEMLNGRAGADSAAPISSAAIALFMRPWRSRTVSPRATSWRLGKADGEASRRLRASVSSDVPVFKLHNVTYAAAVDLLIPAMQ